MSAKPLASIAEDELARHIEALLAAPEHCDNPLREALARLLEHSEGQRMRLERLIRISDGYHSFSRDNNQTLSERYDRQLRRLEKLARISDRYQNSLREVSEALREASLRDSLTGLGNRRFLMERLDEETERANRTNAPYSLGILDIDFFKSINDRHGHGTGDEVLCTIARCVENGLREYDLCGRWGGEEFLIILPETPLQFALQVAERVRQDIKSIHFDSLGHPITACLGLTTYQPGEPFSATINRADAALIRAKFAGKDQVQTA